MFLELQKSLKKIFIKNKQISTINIPLRKKIIIFLMAKELVIKQNKINNSK